MDAAAWSALAAWVTAGIAGGAAYVGLRQYKASSRAAEDQANLAQTLAEEEARPYVVAYMEDSPAGPGFVDLVVRNYGKTAARGVRLTISPEPRQSRQGDETREVPTFEVLGVLAPGQEWRTYWDRTWVRDELGLPRLHQASLEYADSRGTRLDPVALPLDWGPFIDRGTLEVYGMHETAKALRKIEQTLSLFTEHTGVRGVRVYARDGDAKDQAEREYVERMREAEPQDPTEADRE